MGAISALSTAGRTLKRNGALFGAALLAVLVNFGLTAASAVFPPESAVTVSLGLSGVTLLLTPFLLGGLLSMAYEGLDGVTGYGTFLAGGKENYLRLLGAMVLFSVFVGVVAVATVVAAAVVGAFAVGVNATGAAGPLASSSGSVAVLAAVGLASLAAVLLPVFFLQFYAPAIVVSDLGVVDAFRRSAGLVRRNLVSTFGYTAVSILVGLVAGAASVLVVGFGGAAGVSAAAGVVPEMGTAAFAAVAVASLAVATAGSAFGSTYQVAFYDDCS